MDAVNAVAPCPAGKIKVALVDDCILQHKLVEKRISNYPGLELIYRVYNGRELIRNIESGFQLPDVCILDMEMPVMDGIQTAQYLSRHFPAIKMYGFTSSANEAARAQMLRSGVSVVFTKEELKQLLQLIEKG